MGDWLNVIPSITLGLHLHDRKIQCCLCYWLGVPSTALHTLVQNADVLLILSGITRSVVGGIVTVLPGTTLSTISSMLLPSLRLWLPPRRPLATKLAQATSFSPAGALVVPLLSTCSSSALCRSSPLRKQPKHLAMLSKGVQRKLTNYFSACHSSGIGFVPLMVEALAEDTIHTITNVSRAIEDRCGPSDSAPTSKHLYGRLAVALWQGNASLWLHWLPTLSPSLDGLV